jgi:hypothetical protein
MILDYPDKPGNDFLGRVITLYPPSQNTTGIPVDECAICFDAMFAAKTKVAKRGVLSRRSS